MSNQKRSFKRKQRTESVTIPWDPNDFAAFRTEQVRLQEASQALDKAHENHATATALAKAEAELAAAREALDTVLADVETVTFTFRALSPAALEGLLADHPPTTEQIELAKRLDPDADPPDYNGETYPPALIAASCVEVRWPDGTTTDGMSPEQAAEFCETSTTGDVRLVLSIIALTNNAPSLVSDLGKGYGGTRASEPSPTTAAPEGSRPASS